MTTKFKDYINLNDYSECLPAHRRKGYQVCPVCDGKLSIDPRNGKKYTCYSSECDRGDIRRAVLALAGETQEHPDRAAKRAEREQRDREAEAERIAKLRTEDERDREWRWIIANSFLSDRHKQDMLDRGWTEEQIVASNARSSARGRMIPIRTATGKYVGAQVITNNGKRWYAAGASHLKETGELPLAAIYPKNPQIGIIALTESTLDKPYLCAYKFNLVTIGSSNIGSNPKDLARTIEIVKAKYGWNEIRYVMMPDGGAVIDKGVLSRYYQLSNQFTELGKKLQFGWWGQIQKSDGDIDEIDAKTKIRYLLSDEFFAIGRTQLQKVEHELASKERKERQTAADLELWESLTKLSYEPDDRRNEKFLASLPLPKSGETMFVSSGCGTGKTELLAPTIDNWLRANPKAKIIDITHRNSIKDGHQRRLGIGEYKVGFGQNGAALNTNQKVSMCLDSLLQLDLAEIPAGSLLIVDECEAVLNHVSRGGTLGGNTARVQAHFAAILDRVQATGGAVIALEDSITDLAIDGYLDLTGRKYPHKLIVNTHERFNWNVQMGAGSIEDFAADIVDRLKLNENIIVPSSSQRFAETLHKLVKGRIPEIADKIARLDAKTAPDLHDLLRDPNAWFAARNIRLFIYTATIESGCSIDAGYFNRRMAYLVNLETRSHIQLLHRERSDIPTDIFIKERGAEAAGLSKDPHKLFKMQKQIANTTSMAQGRGRILNNAIGETWNQLEAKFSARGILSANHLKDYLKADLVARGHSVDEVDWAERHSAIATKLTAQNLEAENPDALYDRLKEIKKEIGVEENNILFRANGKSISPDRATAILHSSGVRFEERQKAIKCLLHRDLPGANLTEEFLMAAITENRGNYRNACELSWMLNHPDLAKKSDRDIFTQQIESPHIVYSRVPKNQQRVDLLLPLLEHINTLLGGQYDNNTPTVLSIQQYMLKHSYKFRTLFRLDIKPEYLDPKGRRTDTPIATVNKLFKKLGYETESRKVGARGSQVTVYSVANADCPHRQTIYKALDRKYSKLLADDDPVSTRCINNEITQDVDTHSDPHLEVDRVELASAIDNLGAAANASMPDAIEAFGEFRDYYSSAVFAAAIQSLRKERGEWIDVILNRLNTSDCQAA